jgi:hypothetical protein
MIARVRTYVVPMAARRALIMLVALCAMACWLPATSLAQLSWSTPAAIDANGHQTLAAVACPTATQCTAVDQSGQQVTFNPASPGTPTPTSIDPNSVLNAIACVSADQCTAIDQTGHETSAKATSQTSLACSPSSVRAGTTTTCTATVTGTQSCTPTGTVSFTASPASGQFANPGSCTLHASAATPVASCQITFTPSAAASYILTANYTGDSSHLASSGRSTPITATPIPATTPGRASVKHISTSGATTSVQVSCTGSSACTIKLTVSVRETVRRGKVIAIAASSTKTKTIKKTITIAAKTATIPAGSTKTITLTLNGAGKRLLAHHNPLKAKLTVTQSRRTVTSKTIALKPKTKKKKR